MHKSGQLEQSFEQTRRSAEADGQTEGMASSAIDRVRRNFAAAMLFALASVSAQDVQAGCSPEKETFVAMDANSGVILVDHDGDEKIQPASMTKMMTLLLAYEAMDDGVIELDDNIYIASNTYLRNDMERYSGWDSPVRFGDALMGAAVRSYNDLAATIAENVAKAYGAGNTETHFISLMNEKAEEIGMDNTAFYNSSGLPYALIQTNDNGSTTKDMALLLKHIADTQPDLLQLLGTSDAQARRVHMRNTNTLLHKDDLPYGHISGKTGFTCRSGFALTAIAEQDGNRVIASYVGARNPREREKDFMALLDEAFETLEDRQEEEQLREDLSEVEGCGEGAPIPQCIW